MNKASMLLVLLMLTGCHHDTEYVRDPVRQPQKATASVEAQPSHLLPLEANAQTGDSDTAQWQELKNKWGWKVKFPNNWEAYAVGEDTTETGDGVGIQGPKRCYPAGERCAHVGIGVNPLESDSIANLNPRDYLLKQIHELYKRKLISEGETRVAGFPAYEIFFLQQNEGGWPQGKPYHLIAVKRESKILTISYYEDTKDRATINSPADWKLVPIFEKMLSTFSFIPPTCRELPCR